jgi:formylglycine-generating enzyme required for sulfatase activity
MVRLQGGVFLMGSADELAYPGDGEGPVRTVALDPFWIDSCAVSNAHFGCFADATGYVTEAEAVGFSFVFAGLLPDDFPPTRGVAAAPWWRQVEGASWRQPMGRSSTHESCVDHPVVHLTWRDALAYCRWAGKRLPTEAEWEYAARGGLVQQPFPWGDELEPQGEHRMNVWQGTFPRHNTLADGYVGTSPVDAYPPNGYGLYGMTGNVWEWTGDWFTVDHFAPAQPLSNPGGPTSGTQKVARGGSYLCHASYCRRYRVSARNRLTPDSFAGNVGFRCARVESGTRRDR